MPLGEGEVDGEELDDDAAENDLEDFDESDAEELSEEVSERIYEACDSDFLKHFEPQQQEFVAESLPKVNDATTNTTAVVNAPQAVDTIIKQLGVEDARSEVNSRRNCVAMTVGGLGFLVVGIAGSIIAWAVLSQPAADPEQEENRTPDGGDPDGGDPDGGDPDGGDPDGGDPDGGDDPCDYDAQVSEEFKQSVAGLLANLDKLLDSETPNGITFFWTGVKGWVQNTEPPPGWAQQLYVYTFLGCAAPGDTPEEAVVAGGAQALTDQYATSTDVIALLDVASRLQHEGRTMTRKEQLGALIRFVRGKVDQAASRTD